MTTITRPTPTPDLDPWLQLNAHIVPASEPGARRLIVEATLPEGGHIEAHEPPEPFFIPTVLDVTADDGITAGPVAYPQPEERRFDWSPVVLQVLAGTVRLEVPLRIQPAKQQQQRRVTARLDYQACIHGACLPPNAQTVTVAVPA